MALPAPTLALGQVQDPPWVPTPQPALGPAMAHFFISMQSGYQATLRRKPQPWTAIRKHGMWWSTFYFILLDVLEDSLL